MRLFALSVVLTTASCATTVSSQLPDPEAHTGWTPPAWVQGEAAWLLPQLDADPVVVDRPSPSVRALSALVADLDRGEILWARKPDVRRPVASLTKLQSALTLMAVDDRPALDREWCVTPELWPPSPGAMSRFETGVCHPGWDFLGAALVHSDNRGAMALPWLAGLPYAAFVGEMNQTAFELGADSAWVDPTGLGEGNEASARAMLKIVVAISEQPLLAEVASSPMWKISRDRGASVVRTTNRLIDTWETLSAKTGYTDAAHYCFATVVTTGAGRRLGVVVLGAPTDGARFEDTRNLVAWAEAL